MKQKKISENFLDRKPLRGEWFGWTEESGKVTLAIENKGMMNRICQKLFKKPPVSYVHLDEMGSFLWPHLDGEKSIVQLGELVKEKFGEDAEPLYERLAKYLQILESYRFIVWKQKGTEENEEKSN